MALFLAGKSVPGDDPLSVDQALEAWVAGRHLVGVMGGHAALRGRQGYADAARLGHLLGAGLVVATGGGGYLTLYPSNVARPANVSTINFVKNDVVANGAIVPLGPAGVPPNADLRVYSGASGNIDVILDVSGYFQ